MDKISDTKLSTYRYKDEWLVDIFSDGVFRQAWIYKEDFSIKMQFLNYVADTMEEEEFAENACSLIDDNLMGKYITMAVRIVKGR